METQMQLSCSNNNNNRLKRKSETLNSKENSCKLQRKLSKDSIKQTGYIQVSPSLSSWVKYTSHSPQFSSESVETSLIFSIPNDVWHYNICSYLPRATIQSLRLTCQQFRRKILTFPVWKQWIPFEELTHYQKKARQFGWESEAKLENIYGIYVSFASTLFSPTSFQYLALPFLRALDLSLCPSFNPHSLKYLPSCLTNLCINWNQNLTNQDLQYLPPELKSLDLSRCKNITDAGLSFLPRTLTKLNLSYCNITNAGLKALPASLKELDLLSCPQITTDGFHSLSSNLLLRYQYCFLVLTPFIECADKGNLEMIKYFISNRTDVNQTNPNEYTALHFAAKSGHVEVVRHLLDHGALINKQNTHGSTALFIACQAGRKEVVQLLLQRGANPNITMFNKDSPLIISSYYGAKEITEILLKNGADILHLDKYGDGPIEVAQKRGHFSIIPILQSHLYQITKQQNENLPQTQPKASAPNLNFTVF